MRCWPGCEAIIVAPFFSGAVGQVVHVERRAKAVEVLNGHRFRDDDNAVSWVVSGRCIPIQSGPVKLAVIRDTCLRPITPPPGTVIDEVTEPAPLLEPAHV